MSLINPLASSLLTPPLALTQAANKINNKVIVGIFNQVFAQAIRNDDLSFLQDQWILIKVTDIGLSFNLGFDGKRLIQTHQDNHFGLTISADSCHFLDLVSKQKDPDTLFFQRKIKMQGSTELGLYVKNFLDAFEVESHWLSLKTDQILQSTYPMLKKLLCKSQ
ncbi:MAG: SCP2 sterol-binding domain-containing protein [Candidatus Thioglobus sp.]|nr:SCP2 sterol-binding domain-containing protein [Candidatus Thioglobus pontius]MBL6976636.1 SCP2 sterol-binding domain-containing protein [Candidatus Thioglobus sp.]MBL6984129.1 SCP2 sterol-binding domain-containing protein [Candidatus Thioglobus sp.]